MSASDPPSDLFSPADQAAQDILTSKENEKTHFLNDELIKQLEVFKTDLYKYYILKDKNHNPDDVGAMYTFHSIFLQYLGHWIGKLDSELVPMPNSKFTVNSDLIGKIVSELNQTVEGRQLAYMTLSRFTTEHPFRIYDNNVEED